MTDDQLSKYIESLDGRLEALRSDMREDIQRLEKRLGQGMSRLQWYLIGILGSIVIGLLTLILQAV